MNSDIELVLQHVALIPIPLQRDGHHDHDAARGDRSRPARDRAVRWRHGLGQPVRAGADVMTEEIRTLAIRTVVTETDENYREAVLSLLTLINFAVEYAAENPGFFDQPSGVVAERALACLQAIGVPDEVILSVVDDHLNWTVEES